MPRISKAITLDRALLIGIAVAAVGAFLITQHHWLQYGPLVAWVAGALAAVAAVVSWSSWQDARAKIADDYAGQARLVVAEISGDEDEYQICMRNYSDSIIVDAGLEVQKINKDETRTPVAPNLNGPPPDWFGCEIIEPHGRSQKIPYLDLYDGFDCVLRYTDARGKLWQRVNRKQPTAVTGPTSRT